MRLKRFLLMPVDAAVILASGFLSLWLRLEGDAAVTSAAADYYEKLAFIMPFAVALTVALFTVFGLYRSLWQFASVTELARISLACLSASAAILGLCTLSQRPLPRSVYFMWFMLLLMFTGASRISFRVYRRVRDGAGWNFNPAAMIKNMNRTPTSRVMIVGAGMAGSAAIREYAKSGGAVKFVCAVDDDPGKRNMLINGVRVMGGRDDIPRLAESMGISDIIVAIPTARRAERAAILRICNSTGARLKLLPSTNELIEGKVAVRRVRDVRIEDLLRRDEVKLDASSISEYLGGKTVLITGGAGSIGSELCRQVARFGPKRLIVYDLNENRMYYLQHELSVFKELDFVPLVGSVRDAARLGQVFSEHRPDVVFHAAAHKHVPLMESSPSESVKNNIFGTLLTARAAVEAGVFKFVLISTDKAVNPTNVYGATKRMAELVVQAMSAKRYATEFVAVRFGNVLDSDGSVIPIFRGQIERGGPVTLTHRDITRFFMTIPEAAQLVLQAGAFAKGGEMFILDMGQPVRILDLVHDLIRLSGLGLDEIPIEITGLRPGEKLYEELLTAEEGLLATKHEKIFIGKPEEVVMSELAPRLETLQTAAENGDGQKIVELLREYVPTYHVEGE